MFKYFISAIKQNKKYFFVSLFILLILCIFNVAIPFLLKLFLDHLDNEINVVYITTGVFSFYSFIYVL